MKFELFTKNVPATREVALDSQKLNFRSESSGAHDQAGVVLKAVVKPTEKTEEQRKAEEAIMEKLRLAEPTRTSILPNLGVFNHGD
jgi:hypothetical protein